LTKDHEPFDLVTPLTPDSTRFIIVNAVVNYLWRKKIFDIIHKKEVEIFMIA
jgi:hypothetical protein